MQAVKIAQGVAGATFLAAGGVKFHPAVQREFDHFGYPDWFRYTTGAVEIAAGTALLAGLKDSRPGAAGALAAVATMTGAVYSHLVRGRDPWVAAAPAAGLLALAAWVAADRTPKAVRRATSEPIIPRGLVDAVS